MHPWLEYSKQLDAAFCYPCRLFHTGSEATFVLSGYRDWKHATGVKGMFNVYSTTKSHKEAMLNWSKYKKRVQEGSSIGEQLDKMGDRVIKDNREYVKVLMEAVLYCSQQGIAFRGHSKVDDSATINTGNFKNLITLLSRHSTVVQQRIRESSKSASWLSPAIQNEIIHFLADQVRLKIKGELQQAHFFTIFADEAKDSSKREQISIAFRYVSISVRQLSDLLAILMQLS